MRNPIAIISLSLSICALPALCSDQQPGTSNKPDKTGKVITTGHWVPANVQELTGVSATGPFIRLKDGSILTVGENDAQCRISKDEGKTWTDYRIIDSSKYSIWSPVVIQCHSGVIILGFSNGKEKANWNWNKVTHDSPKAILPAYVIRSLDGGRTWQDARKLHEDWTGMNRDIKETKDGHVVFATMMMRHNPGRHTVVTYTTKDDGKTWVRSNVLDLGGSGDHAGAMESTLEQLKDGRLWMLLRTDKGCFWETFSKDDGGTWDEPKPTQIDASSSPGALKRLADGRLVLVWNRLYPEGKNSYPLLGGDNNLSEVPCSWQREELSMMLSDDDGKNWTKPVVIAKNHLQPKYTLQNAWDSKIWLTYPLIFEARPGELWITTYIGGLKIRVNENDYGSL